MDATVSPLFLLFLVLATSPPPFNIADAAKLALASILGVLVVLGGLFGIVWTITQRGRSEWFKMWTEGLDGTKFADAVNRVREPYDRLHALEVTREIDHLIETHNDDKSTHKNSHRHFFAQYEQVWLMKVEKLDAALKRAEDLERRMTH